MRRIICLVILMAMVAGCASGRPAVELSRSRVMNLQLGMPKSRVIELLGKPFGREVYKLQGETLEFFIYITEPVKAETVPDSALTPVGLLNGRVTGWGRGFYTDQKQKYGLEGK